MIKLGLRAIYQKDIKAAILEAKNNNFSILEIHLSSPQFAIDNYTKEDLVSLRKFAEKNNIKLQIHASLEFSLLFTESLLRKAAEKYFIKMIRFCNLIGSNYLTIHPGSVCGYRFSDKTKMNNDDIYRKEYSKLFNDSLSFINNIDNKKVFICIENSDNFNIDYQNILEKFLKKGKIFLTWDIRKNFSSDGELKKDQLDFFKKNIEYVKNIHISGFFGGHGKIEKKEDRFNDFFKLFLDKDIPIIIETLPLDAVVESRKNLENIIKIIIK